MADVHKVLEATDKSKFLSQMKIKNVQDSPFNLPVYAMHTVSYGL